MAKKKVWPRVTAKNGAVFELQTRVMQCVTPSPHHQKFALFSSTRAEVNEALSGPTIRTRWPMLFVYDPLTEATYTHSQVRSGLALGCMIFNKSDAAKIRKWARERMAETSAMTVIEEIRQGGLNALTLGASPRDVIDSALQELLQRCINVPYLEFARWSEDSEAAQACISIRNRLASLGGAVAVKPEGSTKED